MRRKTFKRGFCFFLFLAFPCACFADLYDVPKINPIENKRYALKSEATLQFSYFPMDPFIKYFGLGGSYTDYFSNFTGWEVINAQYPLGFDAGLKRNLISGFGATPNSFQTLQFLATSNLVFSPLYTKNLLFNTSIVHSQTSFVGGAGVSVFSPQGPVACADFGVILRYYLSKRTALKFDFRDYIFLSNSINNNLTLVVGYAFSLGPNDEKNAEFGD